MADQKREPWKVIRPTEETLAKLMVTEGALARMFGVVDKEPNGGLDLSDDSAWA